MSFTRRHLQNVCRRALESGKVLVLLGARQTGKSTLVREMLADVPDRQKLVLLLDDPFLRDRLTQVEGELIRAIEAQAQLPWSELEDFYVVLDEVQKAPALFEMVKLLYDTGGGRVRWILTGSSALAIHDPVAETLAGRARMHLLHPFTLSEGFAHVEGEKTRLEELAEPMSRLLRGAMTSDDFDGLVERARWKSRERQQFLDRQLRWPLFPEPSAEDQPELWLRDYLGTYLEKDVQSLATVGNVALFRACMAQIAARVGSIFKWETAAQEIGTTSVTLRKYVGLMEQTFNLLRLGPFGANPVKRVIKSPKLFFFDNGLLWALRGYEDERLLRRSGMFGVYAEQLALVEIAKWCALEPTAPKLSFWSKTAVSEVDLIVSNRGYHIPFEIKLGRNFEKRWLRGLDAFEKDHRALDLEIPYRIVLHRGEPARPDERTFVLPIWALT